VNYLLVSLSNVDAECAELLSDDRFLMPVTGYSLLDEWTSEITPVKYAPDKQKRQIGLTPME
jgi:hypothetical protein